MLLQLGMSLHIVVADFHDINSHEDEHSFFSCSMCFCERILLGFSHLLIKNSPYLAETLCTVFSLFRMCFCFSTSILSICYIFTTFLIFPWGDWITGWKHHFLDYLSFPWSLWFSILPALMLGSKTNPLFFIGKNLLGLCSLGDCISSIFCFFKFGTPQSKLCSGFCCQISDLCLWNWLTSHRLYDPLWLIILASSLGTSHLLDHKLLRGNILFLYLFFFCLDFCLFQPLCPPFLLLVRNKNSAELESICVYEIFARLTDLYLQHLLWHLA